MTAMTRWMAAAGVALLLAAGALPVLAQTAPRTADPELRARYEAAFQTMLADPGNTEKTLRFAEVAAEIGDPEGAISALERLLLIDRDQARINLELGVLYFRLGSFDAARRYLQRASAAADSTPAVRERVAVYLAEIDRRSVVSGFSGSVTLGMRYQSNANFGPDSRQVRFGGIITDLPSGSSKQSDFNAFALGDLRHVWDLETQDGTVIESNGTLYGTRHFSESQLNLMMVELTTGPRFRPFIDDVPGFSVRPHLIGNTIWIDDSRFSSAGGVGLDLRQEYGPDLSVELTYNLRVRDVRDGSDRPDASDLSGVENSVVLRGRYAIAQQTLLGLDLVYARANADADYNSHDRYGFLLLASHGYAPPFGTGGNWTVSLYGGHLWVDYDSPDPAFDPNTTRRDREWRVGIRNVIPVGESWSVLLQAEHIDNDSSLPNFTFDNTVGLVGLTRRF